jgi:hypothetical protein
VGRYFIAEEIQMSKISEINMAVPSIEKLDFLICASSIVELHNARETLANNIGVRNDNQSVLSILDDAFDAAIMCEAEYMRSVYPQIDHQRLDAFKNIGHSDFISQSKSST